MFGVFRPYVVSADIKILLQEWATAHQFNLPSDRFFGHLRYRFSSRVNAMFWRVKFLHEEKLRRGLLRLLKEFEGFSIVLIDRVYVTNGHRLEITRAVNQDGEPIGLASRVGAPPLETQLQDLAQNVRSPVVVVDDVIFSGEGLLSIINMLQQHGIETHAVCVGVGIRSGVRKVRKRVKHLRCVHTFGSVVDEVCERDFYLGVPLSGRAISAESDSSMPYILPFGRPHEWASIPERRANAFSQFCIKQSERLFREVERRTGRPVRCSDLPQKIYGLPDGPERFVDVLRHVRRELRRGKVNRPK